MIMIGVAILRDHHSPKLMPRWAAFYNFWCALAISPAILIEFFKSGPFTYCGAVDFWFIFLVFFGWIVVMTLLVLRAADALDRSERALASEPDRCE